MTEKNTKDWKKFKEELAREEEQLSAEDADVSEEPILDSLAHPSYAEQQEMLTEAEQKAEQYREMSVRAMAELENVRRRAEREVADAHRFGAQKLITSFLPVMDSLEQAIQLVDKDTQAAMYEGLQLTMQLFIEALTKQGVEQLDPAGEIFNPQEHEAMSVQSVPGAAPNTVITVFQKGYKLADRVIRPARVIVAK